MNCALGADVGDLPRRLLATLAAIRFPSGEIERGSIGTSLSLTGFIYSEWLRLDWRFGRIGEVAEQIDAIAVAALVRRTIQG
jgi:hypothetical protein